MADLVRLVDTKELKSTLWASTIEEKSSPPCFTYDPIMDVLTLMIIPSKARMIVHYIDEHVAFLYLPENKEIIGLRVESFKKSFLVEYSEFQNVWRLSDSGKHVSDFGDLVITVQQQSNKVYKELSKLTGTIAKKQGLKLPVVV